MAVFITGGARSGKSGFAEAYAAKLSERGIYIATAQAWDEEMKERRAHHRLERERSGYVWQTVEEPLALAELLVFLETEHRSAAGRPAVLVDCMTLWLTNWMLRTDQAAEGQESNASAELEAEIGKLLAAVTAYSGPLLLVTNEVGSGIVPAYPLGRRFRDEAGRLNRKLAALCSEAYLVVAGIPLDLKKHAFAFEVD
ncbi:bifunctional adenosylcobinamide kinase/adenosylcobinamide-phosphate guanylyltransferase [Paenibacillus sacheonensis]|uniref:Adenosylcobinamide kinase n=1 Tax=Paenibacillus sacheonensis TaxID=742054 RepID=A0A7X4YMS8_9BACL|nr:bifunctional adenosylcobinamide kinase/adenosylcobinamide-phosphate guanylyltransferase [Paenibacillus sacheonensis]MBM7564707.1 adenosylcobinamide kinase/adenosylcobinamide-phosphate guanylyltransferase [Paenibacillus sacheonensis]NBC69263.1 bifunctional adenosylcobinamide kinase/adenosylcobinamide-phosphate guanylyltransferase [Paenibacillus sacheonensis]